MEKIFSDILINQSCGRSGNGSIDLYTGNLTFIHDILKLNGLNLPMNVSLVYNVYADLYSSDYQIPGHWRLNFMQKLTQGDSDPEDANSESYILEDATGKTQKILTRYYKNITYGSGSESQTHKRYGFKHDSDGVSSEISNDRYILTKSGSNKILTDKAGNKLRFNENGLIISIEKAEAADTGVPKMSFDYIQNQIIITDGSGRKANLYYTSGRLYRITCGEKDVYFEYNLPNNKLERIRYCHINETRTLFSTKFAYCSLSNNVHKLTNIKDSTGLEVEYIYPEYWNCGEFSSVLKYRIKSHSSKLQYSDDQYSGSVIGKCKILDDVTFSYNVDDKDNMTKVTNKYGANNYYYFKSDGRLHVKYDDKGNTQVHSLNTNFTDESKHEGGIEYLAMLKDAQILGTSPNLINPSFAGAISGNSEGESSVSCEFRGNRLEALEEGWYVFSVEAKGDLAIGGYFQTLYEANNNGIPYLALYIGRSFSVTSISQQIFEKFEEKNNSWQIAAVPFYLRKQDLDKLSLDVILHKNGNNVQLRNWSLKKACSYADTNIYGNTSIHSTNGKIRCYSDITKKDNNSRVTRQSADNADDIENIVFYDDKYGERARHEISGVYSKLYDYDSYGNVTKVTEEIGIPPYRKEVLIRECNYDFNNDSRLNKNAVKTLQDDVGNTLTADYNGDTGSLKKTILPGTNQNIDYTYSGIDEKLSEIKALRNSTYNVSETSNKLHYNMGHLTRIEHNGFFYDLVYDGFGRILKVYAGGNQIISTAYTDVGNNIDGVTDAVSKTVTSYEKFTSNTGFSCGQEFCGQKNITAGHPLSTIGVICGQALCGRAIVGNGKTERNNVYASYYNKYGELLKVRHTVNAELDYPFSSSNDYVTVSDIIGDNKRTVTYSVGESKYEYHYNLTSGELIDWIEYIGTIPKLKFEQIGKDNYDRVSNTKYTIDRTDEVCYNYSYKSAFENIVTAVQLPSGRTSTISVDRFGRLNERVLDTESSLKEVYKYKANEQHTSINEHYTTSLVEFLDLMNGGSVHTRYHYTYDSNNNIATISDVNGLLSSYEYDGLNRLIRETANNIATTYAYDNGGNISNKRRGSSAISYVYATTGNKDRLVSYNGSEEIEYDDLGNPQKWFKHTSNGSTLKYKLKWGHISDLENITDEDTNNVYKYTYNDKGIRTEKNINGIIHKYYLDGIRIIAEKIIKENSSHLLKYYYDSTGICGFNHNGIDYYFQKNLQGDIVKVYNNGNLIAEYSYDAWGNHSILNPDGTENIDDDFIGNLNAFRYRGYYYDSETKYYYVNSRYYDPNIGRFLSADNIFKADPSNIGGLNLYAYCYNNPTKFIDVNGNEPKIKVGIDLGGIFNQSGNIWEGHAVPIYLEAFPINNNREVQYYVFEASVLNWKFAIGALSETKWESISVGGNLFQGRINLSKTDSIGIQIGTAGISFLNLSWGENPGFTFLDAELTAATIGLYTQYVDVELQLGSIGGVLKFENGALTIGVSFGWGFKITIRFW